MIISSSFKCDVPEGDLRKWYKTNKNLVVIKMLYNVAFFRRVIRKDIVENGALDEGARVSLLPLTDKNFKRIIALGQTNERYFID